MIHRCGVFLLALYFIAAAGCGGKATTEGKDVGSGPDAQDVSGGEICVGCTPCSSVADCGDPGACVNKVACINGTCEVEFKAAGTACEGGCFVDGKCDGAGQCADTTLKDCPETDGSLCTEPKCETKSGECFEEMLPDGAVPYAGSDCWEGAVCQGGAQDNSNATPTELALECEAMSAEIDPFGCTDSFVCIGGEKGCKEILKTDGINCWDGDKAQGTVCTGQSCLNGECKVDHQFDAECTDTDFPDECDQQCRSCTQLECHWIPDPDPPNPDNPTKKVRYCKAAATIGDSCDDGNACTLDDGCGMGSQTDGPMGKETLGKCVSGDDKECDSYTCAPGNCDPGSGECGFQSYDDSWCQAFSGCLEEADNKCDPKHPSHDSQTGCVFYWKTAGEQCEINNPCFGHGECMQDDSNPDYLFCKGVDEKSCPDDGNPCTFDKCVPECPGEEDCGLQEKVAKCKHVPDDTLPYDDGNECTIGDLCVDGFGVSGTKTPCEDNDTNPCNGPTCVPETGECIEEPIGQGDACGWSGLCVTQVCSEAGECVEAEMMSDGSVDVCNDGIDNDCDGTVDEDCYLEYKLADGWSAANRHGKNVRSP